MPIRLREGKVLHDDLGTHIIGSLNIRYDNIGTFSNTIGSINRTGHENTGLTFATDKNRLWSASDEPDYVYEIGTTGNEYGSIPVLGAIRGLAYAKDTNRLWFADASYGYIHEIGTTGISIGSFAGFGTEIGFLSGLALAENKKLWQANEDSGYIYEIGTTTGNLVGSIRSPCDNPGGLAFADTHLFVSALYDGYIYEVGTADSRIIGSIHTPSLTPFGLAFVEYAKNLWYADYAQTAYLYEIGTVSRYSHIRDHAVDWRSIARNAVGSMHIQNDVIGSQHIRDGAIAYGTQIKNGVIGYNHLTSGLVGTFIKVDGTSTTTALIPFAEGLSSGFIRFDEIEEPDPPISDTALVYGFDRNGITTLQFLDSTGFPAQFLRDNLLIVRNTVGSLITKCQVVYITGSTGNIPNVGLAKADSENTLPAIGVVAENIADTGFGRIIIFGKLRQCDTSGFTEGDIVYVSETVAGAFTKVKPVYPYFIQRIGVVGVSGVGNGTIEVDVNSIRSTNVVPYTGAVTNVDIGVYTLTGNRFISTVAVGTSPYSCTSTTLNTNLNADLVDGVNVATLTNTRLLRYNSTGTQIENSVISEIAGGLLGVVGIVMSGQLTSTLATGTSPFSIASTTKCSNLNVDFVDSVHVASLTNTRLLRYNSTGTQIENATVTESAGALAGITTLSMSGQLTSTLAIGTSPFNVTSTTVCTNLNVDLLDGYHVGTSGAVVPILNATNTWGAIQKFTTGNDIYLQQGTSKPAVAGAYLSWYDSTFTTRNAYIRYYSSALALASGLYIYSATDIFLTAAAGKINIDGGLQFDTDRVVGWGGAGSYVPLCKTYVDSNGVFQFLPYDPGGLSQLTGFVFNDDGYDVDFRVESDTNSNCFLLDAGNSNININGISLSAHYDLGLLGNGVLCLKETTTPTADANHGKIYCKNDDKLYFQDGAGNEKEIAFVS